ncbi:MFS family permease [Cryobacterium sp. MP_3.1]|uniref:hypothetical protein n=1 Tax=Cryobacterium sp. MP_3.1 TaxID=3071711 RepID=UPI002E084A69|nr:MFS family permease [Cryobacterium sp. MP_3.1]
MLKKIDQWDARILHAGMIALMLAVFVWFAGDRLLEASVFLSVGAVYAFLLVRVVSRSFRAFTVMLWSFLLNYWMLISLDVDGALDIPAAGPWFIGFMVGSIAGGYIWSGPGAGRERTQTRPRRPDADGKFSGGWRLALINAACALVLFGIGTAQLVLLSPTAPAVAVLVVAVIAGWALFRLPLPLEIRNGLLSLGLPVVWFALAFVGGATDQMALPHASAYGALAGILIGGRYWSGPQFGAPRPPFNGQGRRRRRRKRRPKQQKQTQRRSRPAVAAAREKQAKDR